MLSLRHYDREKLTLGYAATSFSAQGGSFENVYLFVHGHMTDAQTAYVMGSRHKHKCSLYTTLDDAGENLSKLVRDMSRDRMKLLAHDTAPYRPEQQQRRRFEQDLGHDHTL